MEKNAQPPLNSKLKIYFFLTIFVLIVFLFFVMFSTMWQLVVIAFLFALLFYPFYLWLSKKTKLSVGLKAGISILVLYAAIIIPLVFVFSTLLQEIVKVSEFLDNPENVSAFLGNINAFFKETFNISLNITVEQIDAFLEKNIQSIINFFANSVLNIANFSFFLFTQTVFFTIFFVSLLPNLSKLKNYFFKISPLGEKMNILYLENVNSMLNNVIFVAAIVAALQGISTAILFTIMGIPLATFFGFIVFVLGFIPVIGPSIVLIPVGIILLLLGQTMDGIILIVMQLTIIGNMEYVIRPLIKPKKISIHVGLIIFGIMAGMSAFGFMGIFIGPTIVILLFTSMDILMKSYKHMENKKK